MKKAKKLYLKNEEVEQAKWGQNIHVKTKKQSKKMKIYYRKYSDFAWRMNT